MPEDTPPSEAGAPRSRAQAKEPARKKAEAEFRDWRHRQSKRIGAEIQRHRIAKGLKVTDLAETCGIPRMTLSNIENGSREGLTHAELWRIAIALDVLPIVFEIPPNVGEIEILPGVFAPVTEVVSWLADPASDVSWINEDGFVTDSPQIRRSPDALRVRRLLNHHRFLAVYQSARATRPDSAQAINTGNLLKNTRQQMREAGEWVPPLPPELADLEPTDEEFEAVYNSYLSLLEEGQEL